MYKWMSSSKSEPAILLHFMAITFLAHMIQDSAQTVRVEFGHFLEPFVSTTEGSTFLENKDIRLNLKCMANYPTELIFNDDNLYINSPNRYRIEWTDRKFDKTIDESVYNYIAWILLQYPMLVQEETLVCRSVSDHKDFIIVKFTPTDNNQVQITNFTNTQMETQGSESESTNSGNCGSQLEVVSSNSGYYWRCVLKNGSIGSIEFNDCPYSASYCANTFRDVKKMKTCATMLSETTDISGWQRMANDDVQIPGVAVCLSGNPNERRAVEYFFSGLNLSIGNKQEPRKLHISWSEIQPLYMIWMDPPLKNVYYTQERLITTCRIPKYGFSFDPVLIVTLNRTRLFMERGFEEDGEARVWFKKVDLSLGKHGIGEYRVHCIAPVWNTTEWANKTTSFIVKDYIPPYFDKSFENVTYEDGQVNQHLTCEANGDPKPKIEWDSTKAPAKSRVDGSTFIFTKVTYALTDGNYMSCTATNEFGDKAVKEFLIYVTLPEPKSDGDQDGSQVIIIIVCVLVIGLILAGGLVFLYFKFLKLGNQIQTYLTYDEVKEFREGKVSSETKPKSKPGYENEGCGKLEDDAVAINIDYLAFNSEYEIAKENLFVDFNMELGSGEYGIVYKGTIKLNAKDSNPLTVAIKTVRKNVHISYFKALMSELKIMAYIGRHENVVNLIGAYTSDIKNRELFVGVELCKSSLLKCLQSNRHNFQNFIPTNDILLNETAISDYENQGMAEKSKTLSTYDLIQWAGEIASGMEFLSTKKVVHGDLAARNILISFESHAKICDFGLARQLIDYNYIKSQQCPLPWKWMAIESLSQMKFSTMSDVWAYGIILWEIFALGNVPYPGMAWNLDFVDQLTNGLRMSKPTYADDTIYNTMVECWRENPKDRPKFKELREFFQSLQVKSV